MPTYSLGDFEVSIGGQLIGTYTPLSVTSFIEATNRLSLPAEPLEFTFDISPETTGQMPDCVKLTRRSRRRWRGKGRNWNSLWKGWV